MATILIPCPHCGQSSSYPDNYSSSNTDGTSNIYCNMCKKCIKIQRDGHGGIKGIYRN